MTGEPSADATLVVFCRRPAPGVGKQRIAVQAGADFAHELGERLLATALEDAVDWPGPVVLAPAAAADAGWARALLHRAAGVAPQPEGKLGERLQAVDRALRADGHQRLIYIGSDAPTLHAGLFAAARRALEQTDVVLAPAADGGVTLMGARVPWPGLRDLPWSTPALGDALVERCRALGLTVTLLDTHHDVDTIADLSRLCRELAADARPARRALRAWLQAPGHGAGAHDAAVSVIVPVLEDTDALARLLPVLRGLQPPPAEIIVADGADSPACRRLCAQHGAQHLATAPGRGRQLRAGADTATGAVLWFLHADAEPPADAVAAMAAAVAGGASGGYFRFRFAGHAGWPQRALAALINLRARFGIAYGDQGIFATRAAYTAAGGFADSPLFEEVPLVRGLRRGGRFLALRATLGVSPRRWQRDGWWRRTVENRLLALGYLAGVAPERLAKHYHARRAAGPAGDDGRKAGAC